jgi:hypothetical protein
VEIPALVSRSFTWKIMIAAAAVRFLLGPPFRGASPFPWISAACMALSIVVLDPLMDRDLPTFADRAMLKSARTYLGAALIVASWLTY